MLAQLVRALHRYRRGQGSSPGKPDFFRLSFRNCISCVNNCEDLLYTYTYLSVVYRNDTPRDQDVDLQSQNYLLIQLVVIPCGTKFLRVLIFAIFAVFSTIRKKKFPPKKFPTKIFFAKIYSTVEKSRKLNDEIEVGTLFTVKISKEKDRLKVPHLLMG